MANKTCSKCGKGKPLEDFHRCKKAADGRQSWCKSCRLNSGRWRDANPERAKELDKRWREENPEKVAAIRRRSRRKHKDKAARYTNGWRKRNPEKNAEHLSRYRERYPEKARARAAVNNAVRRGKITKPSVCEDCGAKVDDSADLHAHHNDYSKPLEVEWVCRDCHNPKRHSLPVAA